MRRTATRRNLALLLCLGIAGGGPAPLAFGQASSPARSVRVVQGDTLEAIAARYGVSLPELMRLNRITRPEELQIGQQLKLPASKGQVQVRAGDTLESLAAGHGTSVAALSRANPGLKPAQLKVGAWLTLPPASPDPAASTTTTKSTTKPAAQSTTKPVAKSTAAKSTAAAKPQPAPRPEAAASSPAAARPAAASGPPALMPPMTPRSPGANAPPAPQLAKPGDSQRWRFFGNTLVDWGGWKLHPGGVRVTLVQPTAADVGATRAQAMAVAVHCGSLRQAWLIDGAWGAWSVPEARSVPQQIVLELCANVTDPIGPALPPPAAP